MKRNISSPTVPGLVLAGLFIGCFLQAGLARGASSAAMGGYGEAPPSHAAEEPASSGVSANYYTVQRNNAAQQGLGFGGGSHVGRSTSRSSTTRQVAKDDKHGQREVSLVVPAQEPDFKMMLEMEEDLNVMARLLEKAAGIEGESKQWVASGIELMFSPAGAQRPQNLYLEGYGALFLLTVEYPLVPVEESAETEPEQKTSTAWEEAKRDLYGDGMGMHFDRNGFHLLLGDQFMRTKYDPARVEELKTNLTQALQEAVNMRHLKPDDYVTAVITSFWATASKHIFGLYYGSRPQSNAVLPAVSHPNARADSMIVRARKADIDAVSEGSMSAEEFQEKVTLLTY
jgi:hypothetical protein